MIILLTGRPGVGKSTAIEKFIALNKEPAVWVITSGILRPGGDRGGFMAINSAGEKQVISHKTDIKSSVVVGENHVDVAAVDAMFGNTLEEATRPGGTLTIIDEIGPIQLYSTRFVTALEKAFADGRELIATIHYSDERLEKYRAAANAVLLRVSTENRDMIPKALVVATKNRVAFNSLNGAQKAAVANLFRRYVNEAKLLQVQKLFENAIHYVKDGAITKQGKEWEVAGHHGLYMVAADGAYTCQCALFRGKGEYEGRAGECSHIQSVIIYNTKDAP